MHVLKAIKDLIVGDAIIAQDGLLGKVSTIKKKGEDVELIVDVILDNEISNAITLVYNQNKTFLISI